MGLIGILAASILNIFLASDGLSWAISIVGVVIFTALTAYDVQRIQNGELAIQTGSMEKAAVIGALHLYLDFVNLFLFMLRLFGGRTGSERPEATRRFSRRGEARRPGWSGAQQARGLRGAVRGG